MTSYTVPTNRDRAEIYLPKHCTTPEFAVQERIRDLDVAVWTLAVKELGPEQGKALYEKGWGQMLGAAIVVTELSEQGTSTEFTTLVHRTLSEAMQLCASNETPFKDLNFKKLGDDFLKFHPLGKRPPWRTISMPSVLQTVQALFLTATPVITLRERRFWVEFSLPGGKDLLKELWASAFPQELTAAGFSGLQINQDLPHLTLATGPEIARLRAAYRQKGESHFDQRIRKILESVNEVYVRDRVRVTATSFRAGYSESYTKFRELVVVDVDGSPLTPGLKILETLVKGLTNEAPKLKSVKKAHLTAAVLRRAAKDEDVDGKTLEMFVSRTGKYEAEFSAQLSSITES
jgi:hypothetical protein